MKFSKLDKFIDEMPLRGFPACELAVSVDGKEIYHRAAGFSDSAKTVPAKNTDLYWIYSTTKVITCIAAMRLVEEGRLGLDDPVSKYIPEYANMKVQAPDGSLSEPKNEMKIWHLFTMTGGLTYELQTPNIMGATTRESNGLAIAKAITLDPLVFEPGTRFRYSLCHDVLGVVCEVITGMRFSEYLSELIFKPLSLTDIGFTPNEEQKKRFSAMYIYNTGSHTATEIPCENELKQLVNFESAGGGLFSTVSDYLKIVSVIACGGATKDGYRILKPETIAMMQKDMLNDVTRKDMLSHNGHHGYSWGLGCCVHIDPIVSLSPSPIGQFGWDGAAGAYTLIDPENRLAIFYATHVHKAGYGYHVVHPNIKKLVYEAIK